MSERAEQLLQELMGLDLIERMAWPTGSKKASKQICPNRRPE